ncbi:hypothetical protein BC941DRAFT_425165 [Chlamydoabsidia padenii]|nr:hypothetical protein BC941DRAFT_425165 [Chlamydoabsidia padenii]
MVPGATCYQPLDTKEHCSIDNGTLSSCRRPIRATSSSLPSRSRSHLGRTSVRPQWETIHVRDSWHRGTTTQRPFISDKTTTRRRCTSSPYLLSVVAREFMQQMVLTDRLKDGIEYKYVFDGQQAVDKLMVILDTKNRSTAIKVGRALGDQGCFHDVQYENVLLDSSTDIYQFKDVFFYNQPTSDDTWMKTSSSSSSDYSTTDHTILDEECDSALTTPTTELSSPLVDCFVNGIYTPLTRCYAPSCDERNSCYSPLCPNQQLLKGVRTSIDSRTIPHTYLRQREQTSWAEMVSPQVLQSVSTTERKRQEAICELIYTEVNFVMDLDYVCKMWVNPLLTQDIIPQSRRHAFVQTVFSNITTIHQHHARLAKRLRKRQADHPIVVEIGDTLLGHVDDFCLIIDYGAKQHKAKFVYEKERYLNPKFDAFARYTERHPSSHKLELNGYLTKPTTRLGRYPLLLDAILRRTPKDHPDHDVLITILGTVKGFLSKVNMEAGNAKNRFDLEHIHHHLSFKRRSDRLDLKLLEPGRRITREGFLNKKPNLDSVDYQVILFDHYLVVAKIKWIRAEKHYQVVRRPLAIPFLAISIPSYLPTPQRSNSLLTTARHSYQQQKVLVTTEHDSAIGSINNGSDNKQGHPVLFQHMGRKKNNDSHYVLYAASQASRKPWIDQIRQLQAIEHSPTLVFDLHPAVQRGQFKYKKINHVVPFQNNQLLVFAMDDGVYAGKNDPDASVHKVLDLERVTHLHVIEEFQLLLVLSDKTLWHYVLTDVMNGKHQPPGRRIQTNVPFFHVGTCLSRTLVCVPQVSPLKSVITMLEPCKPQAMTDRKPTLLQRLTGNGSSTDVSLKKFKQCYIPCEAWAVELSMTKLWITGHRGIMLVDMQRTDRTQPMLNPEDDHLTFITDREKQESTLKIKVPIKRISVFRTTPGDYLVCYDEYAFYVNAKGNRVQKDFLIEWEGCSESYALVWPYVIAFESSFIEIRSAITGQLEQVIRGERIRCLERMGDTIYGVMVDPDHPDNDYVFKLTLMDQSDRRSLVSLSTAIL